MREHPERWRMLAQSLLQFTPIKRNRFLERNKTILNPNDFMNFQCQCEPISHSYGKSRLTDTSSYDCGDQCLNRSVNQDCLPQVCPVGEGCKNRRFQLHQNSYVYPIKTSNKGWGLAAGEFIKKGQFVMQYVGEVFYVDSEIGKARIEKYKNSTCTYMMRTENGEVIDPTTHGNIARFINHSCEPNCVTRKWTVLGETSVGIFALKNIEEDEELSFDYQFDTFKTPFTRCYCGTSKCKGYLGLGVFEDEAENKNAPICGVCKEQISETYELLVCKGPCKQVFHYRCAAAVDKRAKFHPEGQSVSKQKYLCKACYYEVKGKKKPGRKVVREAEDQNDEENNKDMSHEAKDVQPKVSRLIHTDPEAVKFTTNSHENLVIDKVIKREIVLIDKLRNDGEENGSDQFSNSSDGMQRKKVTKGKRKRKVTQYSAFYNFYFELCYRLKKRMKENIAGFKFRKNQLPSESEIGISRPGRRAKGDRNTKRKKSFESSLSAASAMDVDSAPITKKKSRTVPKQKQTAKAQKQVSENSSDNRSQAKSNQSMEDLKKSPLADNLSNVEEGEAEILEEQFEQNSEENSEENSAEKFAESFEKNYEENSNENNNQEEGEEEVSDPESAEEEMHESQQEDSDEDSQDLEELEEMEEELSAEREEDDPNEDLEEELEEELEEDLDEELEDESDEDMAFSEEESEEEIQDSSEEEISEAESSEDPKSAITPPVEELKVHSKQRSHPIKAQKQKRGPRKKLGDALDALKTSLAANTGTPMNAVRKQSQVDKDLANQAKQKIAKEIRDLTDQLLKSELDLVAEGEASNYKINVYDLIFRVVFDSNTDILECVPGLFFTWNAQWGNLVTVRITTYARQYKKLMNLIYYAGNLLQKANLLSEYVGISYDNLQRQSSLPFLIMKLMFCKNLMKKMIGYQGRTLGHYRKKYAVNFDYDDSLINDNCYQVFETSPFYVFGRGRDVIKVSQLLQAEIDSLYVKTLHITKEEQNFIFVNIKEIKQLIDPCEIRVKRVIKDKAEINHPFFQIPNLQREVCLIGNEQEIVRAEQRLYEFYSSRFDAPDITKTSLCWLLPMMLHGEKRSIKTELNKVYPDLTFLAIDPIFPRKHITIYLQGPWKTLLVAKETLIKIVNPSFNRIWQPSYKSFEEFQLFTEHQALKFCFKQLKRSQLDNSCKLQTHWDVSSDEVEQICNYRQLRIQGEQEEYILISRLLGKEFLLRMRQILSKEVHIEPCSIFQHEDLKAKFDQLHPEQQKIITELRKRRKYLKHYRQEQFKSMLRYMKVHDQETCLNALYVLSNSPQSLEELLTKLTLTKDQIIIFAQNLIQELITSGKYPTLSQYIKYSQTIEAKAIAERNIQLKQKRRLKAIEAYKRYKEHKEREIYEQFQRRQRRSRSRSCDSVREPKEERALFQPPPMALTEFAASSHDHHQQAYEVLNPTQPKDEVQSLPVRYQQHQAQPQELPNLQKEESKPTDHGRDQSRNQDRQNQDRHYDRSLEGRHQERHQERNQEKHLIKKQSSLPMEGKESGSYGKTNDFDFKKPILYAADQPPSSHYSSSKSAFEKPKDTYHADKPSQPQGQDKPTPAPKFADQSRQVDQFRCKPDTGTQHRPYSHTRAIDSLDEDSNSSDLAFGDEPNNQGDKEKKPIKQLKQRSRSRSRSQRKAEYEQRHQESRFKPRDFEAKQEERNELHPKRWQEPSQNREGKYEPRFEPRREAEFQHHQQTTEFSNFEKRRSKPSNFSDVPPARVEPEQKNYVRSHPARMGREQESNKHYDEAKYSAKPESRQYSSKPQRPDSREYSHKHERPDSGDIFERISYVRHERPDSYQKDGYMERPMHREMHAHPPQIRDFDYRHAEDRRSGQDPRYFENRERMRHERSYHDQPKLEERNWRHEEDVRYAQSSYAERKPYRMMSPQNEQYRMLDQRYDEPRIYEHFDRQVPPKHYEDRLHEPVHRHHEQRRQSMERHRQRMPPIDEHSMRERGTDYGVHRRPTQHSPPYRRQMEEEQGYHKDQRAPRQSSPMRAELNTEPDRSHHREPPRDHHRELREPQPHPIGHPKAIRGRFFINAAHGKHHVPQMFPAKQMKPQFYAKKPQMRPHHNH